MLAGHSTGGLTATLYAAHHPNHPLIKALWANSPFYDFNLSLVEKKFGIPVLSRVGKYLPKVKFPSQLTNGTPRASQTAQGRMGLNLDWKPTSAPTVQLSFLHAIHTAQKEIHRGVKLNVPALIMHSHQTKTLKMGNRCDSKRCNFRC